MVGKFKFFPKKIQLKWSIFELANRILCLFAYTYSSCRILSEIQHINIETFLNKSSKDRLIPYRSEPNFTIGFEPLNIWYPKLPFKNINDLFLVVTLD